MHVSYLGIIQASGWLSSSQPLTREGQAGGLGTRQGAPTSPNSGAWGGTGCGLGTRQPYLQKKKK